MNYNKISQFIPILRKALKEDVGRRDITTEITIPKDKWIKAVLLVKESCVVCGLDIAGMVFKIGDNKTKFNPLVKDGQFIKKGKGLAQIQGRARSILTTERVALNFLSLLSGIATKTREYVNRVKLYKVKIMDTRKTIPGLRDLEKYAVRVGGGFNHRFRLDEMVIVKDNHFACLRVERNAPCAREIIGAVKKRKLKNMKVEIEVKNLREFKEALKVAPDIIMLDNMKITDIKKVVAINRKANRKPLLEASGGITLKNVKRVAATGVDMISTGELTHSVKSIDISLEVI